MMNNFDVNENVQNLFEKLENFLKSKTVVGEAITIGDAILIPFISVSFGLGSVAGDGGDGKGNGVGGGAGVGAKVSPTAVLLIKGDKTELIPISKITGLERLLEMVPDIVNKVNAVKGKNDATAEAEK